jgi:hypothetical protein
MKIKQLFIGSPIVLAGCLSLMALNTSPVEAAGKTQYECHYRHYQGEMFFRSRPIVKSGFKQPWRKLWKRGMCDYSKCPPC